LPVVASTGLSNFTPFFQTPNPESVGVEAVLHASALMFVAYTGMVELQRWGRSARTGRTIPKAIIITMVLTMLLYHSRDRECRVSGVHSVRLGCESCTTGNSSPSLEFLAVLKSWLRCDRGDVRCTPQSHLGLSRVLLAMGRRRRYAWVMARLNG